MARYLVIVESPAKVKTIKKFLGSNYVVTASNGHVRDMPKSQMGIDIENDYEPKYITIRGKGEILAKLRKEVKKADKIYLATDPDREGEAISSHLSKALKLEDKKVYRISFNEITKNAVKASLKNPREIDMDLVDAQQARRVLDRIVGYKISPLQLMTGNGIADEIKPRIFDMFYSGANQIADSRRSLGLGLSLCKSIINAHGGELTVSDNLPHGTVFTFTLPAGEVKVYE